MKKKHKHHMGKASHHGTSENEGRPWGHGEFANMPKEAVMKPYPMNGHSLDGHLDDTMGRLDTDSQNAESIVRRQNHKSMY